MEEHRKNMIAFACKHVFRQLTKLKALGIETDQHEERKHVESSHKADCSS